MNGSASMPASSKSSNPARAIGGPSSLAARNAPEHVAVISREERRWRGGQGQERPHGFFGCGHVAFLIADVPLVRAQAGVGHGGLKPRNRSAPVHTVAGKPNETDRCVTSLDQPVRRFLGPGEIVHKYAIGRNTRGGPSDEHDRCPVHWPGAQMPVVVAFRGNDYALDSTAQEFGTRRASRSVSLPAFTNMTVRPCCSATSPIHQGQLRIKWVGQVADDEADGVSPTADPQVAGCVVSQITKLLYRSWTRLFVSSVIRGSSWSARETVITLTPARVATSRMVGTARAARGCDPVIEWPAPGPAGPEGQRPGLARRCWRAPLAA